MFAPSILHSAAGALALCLFIIFSQVGCASSRNGAGIAASPASRVAKEAEFAEFASLLGRRLALAEKVALVKFRERLPVEDRPRENNFLAAVEERAVAAGVDHAQARAFFAAQIEASKREQSRLLRAWKSGLPLPGWGALSLRDDVRPELDRLTPLLLAGWQAVRHQPGLHRRLYRELRQQGWSIPVARAAVSF